MNWEAIIFWALATGVTVPALGIVFSRNIVHMAFWLLAVLVGIAGLYLLLGADFLGMTQIFVYVGGISVLLLFGIMLTNSEPVYVRRTVRKPRLLPALCLGALVYIVMLKALMSTKWLQEVVPPLETARSLGIYLLSEYILPFEIVSIVLLVVLIGAAFIARRENVEGQG